MAPPFLRVLGSADWQPTKNNDHSCYTINDKVLIDACPSVITNLLGQDVDPVSIHTLCFTHMHADHIMGLPPLLLYFRVRTGSLGGLTIIGPGQMLQYYREAFHFVFHTSPEECTEVTELPHLIETSGAQTFDRPEVLIQTLDADHAVPGLCYRITDKATGRAVGLTGDTRYRQKFGGFFKDTDLLVHEVSFGTAPLTKVNEICRHSSVREAVQVAQESHCRHLLLTHTYEPKRKASLEYAQNHLRIPTDWALPYHTFPF